MSVGAAQASSIRVDDVDVDRRFPTGPGPVIFFKKRLCYIQLNMHWMLVMNTLIHTPIMPNIVLHGHVIIYIPMACIPARIACIMCTGIWRSLELLVSRHYHFSRLQFKLLEGLDNVELGKQISYNKCKHFCLNLFFA